MEWNLGFAENDDVQFNSNNDAEVLEDTHVNEEDNEPVHFQDFQKPDF